MYILQAWLCIYTVYPAHSQCIAGCIQANTIIVSMDGEEENYLLLLLSYPSVL